MEKKFMFDEELFDSDDELEEELDEQSYHSRDLNACLTEIDFYPPSDNRTWVSNIEDIDGGDNFADFCKYIFKLFDSEGYYDN